MHSKKEFTELAADFRDCRAVLAALGDENRMHILYQMMVTAVAQLVSLPKDLPNRIVMATESLTVHKLL